MEIHALKMSITEQDINALLHEHLPADQPIEDLAVTLSPKGLTVAGVYPLFINVHFETLWLIGVDGGAITARLDNFKAMGVPGNIFKSAVVKMIEDVAGTEGWLRIQGDTLWVDVDRCLAKYAFPAQTHLTSVECLPGQILIQAAG